MKKSSMEKKPINKYWVNVNGEEYVNFIGLIASENRKDRLGIALNVFGDMPTGFGLDKLKDVQEDIFFTIGPLLKYSDFRALSLDRLKAEHPNIDFKYDAIGYYDTKFFSKKRACIAIVKKYPLHLPTNDL